jgi:hypothetical protein
MLTHMGVLPDDVTLYATRYTSLSGRLHCRLASTLPVGLRSNRNLPLSSDKLPAGWVSTGCLKQQ